VADGGWRYFCWQGSQPHSPGPSGRNRRLPQALWEARLVRAVCISPPSKATHSAVPGDATFCLQPVQVVLPLVVGPQMRVMQAVVFRAEQAAARVSQIEIARGLVKL